MTNLLHDRVGVVTGTGPNIGTGIALALSAAGADVACVDRNPAYAQACAKEVQAAGGRAVGVAADVTDEAAVEALVRTVVDDLGRIDILVNGAAFYNEKGILEMPVDEWRAQLDVILAGAFLCTRAVARHMIDRGVAGSVVNLASTAGHQGQPGNIAYATAKAGILNFTRAAAMDLAPFGIRVNSVTPTSTAVAEADERAARFGVDASGAERIDRLERRRALLPLGRLPHPNDYGQAVVFLASDQARMVTGTDLRVDSGALADYWGRLDDDR